MSQIQEPFVAFLVKDGETEPYAFKELTTLDWDEGTRLAKEWGKLCIDPANLDRPTSLFIKRGAESRLLERWGRI